MVSRVMKRQDLSMPALVLSVTEILPPLSFCCSLSVSAHSISSSSRPLFVIHHQMEQRPASAGLCVRSSQRANRIYFTCTASISIRANGSAGQHAAQLWSACTPCEHSNNLSRRAHYLSCKCSSFHVNNVFL